MLALIAAILFIQLRGPRAHTGMRRRKVGTIRILGQIVERPDDMVELARKHQGSRTC